MDWIRVDSKEDYENQVLLLTKRRYPSAKKPQKVWTDSTAIKELPVPTVFPCLVRFWMEEVDLGNGAWSDFFIGVVKTKDEVLAELAILEW